METMEAIATANKKVIISRISEKDKAIHKLEEENKRLQEIINARGNQEA